MAGPAFTRIRHWSGGATGSLDDPAMGEPDLRDRPEAALLFSRTAALGRQQPVGDWLLRGSLASGFGQIGRQDWPLRLAGVAQGAGNTPLLCW